MLLFSFEREMSKHYTQCSVRTFHKYGFDKDLEAGFDNEVDLGMDTKNETLFLP